MVGPAATATLVPKSVPQTTVISVSTEGTKTSPVSAALPVPETSDKIMADLDALQSRITATLADTITERKSAPSSTGVATTTDVKDKHTKKTTTCGPKKRAPITKVEIPIIPSVDAARVLTLGGLYHILKGQDPLSTFRYNVTFHLCEGPWEPMPQNIQRVDRPKEKPWNVVSVPKTYADPAPTVKDTMEKIEPFLVDHENACVIDPLRISWRSNDFYYRAHLELELVFRNYNPEKDCCDKLTENASKTADDEPSDLHPFLRIDTILRQVAPLSLDPPTLECVIRSKLGAAAAMTAVYRVGDHYYTKASLEKKFPGLFLVSTTTLAPDTAPVIEEWRKLFMPLRSPIERCSRFDGRGSPHIFLCSHDEKTMLSLFGSGQDPLKRLLRSCEKDAASFSSPSKDATENSETMAASLSS